MRSTILVLLAAASLAACNQGNPVADQALKDTRYDPMRADDMLAIGFQPGTSGLDATQINALHGMVDGGRRAQRDEFVVVTDGSGGTLQQLRAQRVRQSLSSAGARWVSTSLEPGMAMGPDKVVVVRSEYLIATNNCPNYNPSSIGNPNESPMPGIACADAYNMGQMLARPRDAAMGRAAGLADGTVNADAVQRYREGRVRVVGGSGGGGGAGAGGAAGGSGAGGGGGLAPPTF
jgi:pilus biogenesis lipoprotein CpaD